MNLDQYTNDAICRSMGWSGFVEPVCSSPTLRVLLKPSFHPEISITLDENDQKISVVALAESFWSQSVPCELPSFSEHVLLPVSVVTQLVSDFRIALEADRNRDGRMVCLDGMGVASCLFAKNGVDQFDCHPYRPEVSNFISSLIQAVWLACRDAGVRNALATCGGYVYLNLTRQPEPAPPMPFRVGVFGTPDDRAEFFKQLEGRRSGITNG